MGLFSGIRDKKVRQRNDYIPEGEHTLKFGTIKQDKAFKGYDFVVAELEVLTSDNPKLKTGQVVSFFLKCENDKPWQENLKAFLGACMGYEDANDVDEADVETALAADNPLKDVPVRCVGRKRTSKAGREYTALNWYRVEDAVEGGEGEAAAQ